MTLLDTVGQPRIGGLSRGRQSFVLLRLNIAVEHQLEHLFVRQRKADIAVSERREPFRGIAVVGDFGW